MNLLQDSRLLASDGQIVYVQSTGDWLRIDSATIEGYAIVEPPPYPEFPHFIIRGPEPVHIKLDKH